MSAFHDALLRYQLRLDGLSNETKRLLMKDIEPALLAAQKRLAGLGTETYGLKYTIRDASLRSLVQELASLRAALAESLGETLDASLVTVAEAASVAVEQALGHLRVPAAIEAVRAVRAVPVARLVATKDQPFDGHSWRRWGAKLADDTVGRIESEMRQAVALGEGTGQLSQRLRSVADLSRTSATKLARTATTATASRATAETYRASGVVKAYRFTAILDGRTSTICGALDGTEFAIGAADIPYPPRHPNCRSVLVPVLRDDLQAEAGPEPKVYSDWLAEQPEDFQRETLGRPRYEAWKAGLSLGDMATYDRRLTAGELRRMYPREMPSAEQSA